MLILWAFWSLRCIYCLCLCMLSVNVTIWNYLWTKKKIKQILYRSFASFRFTLFLLLFTSGVFLLIFFFLLFSFIVISVVYHKTTHTLWKWNVFEIQILFEGWGCGSKNFQRLKFLLFKHFLIVESNSINRKKKKIVCKRHFLHTTEFYSDVQELLVTLVVWREFVFHRTVLAQLEYIYR